MGWTNDSPPDPLSAANVGEFVDRMRSLKIWAGNPSFEELRRRSGVASSTLADALKPGRTRLPRLETVTAFLAACGVSAADRRRWESAWRSLQSRKTEVGGRYTPHQLPRPASPFIGRQHLLDQLDLVQRERARRREPALVVLVGGAGTGKSTLATQWAHRVAARYPDGQLHLDLRGFARGPAVSAHDALAHLLGSLGVPQAHLPADLTGRIALYRSLTYSRRLLVVLDAARDAAQIAPLLPAGSHCLTVVSSRSRLSELVAREGGHRFVVSTLSPLQSVALLAAVLGRERTDREPESAARLADLCGHLPLALRIAATCLADRPEETIAEYAAQLRLNGLTGPGYGGLELCAALEPSYLALDEPARSLLRLVGAHGRAGFGAGDVAAWTGAPAVQVERLLHALRAVHLIDAGPDGYLVNRVVWAFVKEVARDEARATVPFPGPTPAASAHRQPEVDDEGPVNLRLTA